MTQSAIEWTERNWNPARVVDGIATLQLDQLLKPLRWRKPARAFVGDIFHESLPDSDIDKIFAVMALCPRHTFQILTKRPGRMQEYVIFLPDIIEDVARQAGKMLADGDGAYSTVMQIGDQPLSNVWLGVSVHDQASAEEFVPMLLATPAAKRFVSYEPALGPVDWVSPVYRGLGGISMQGYLPNKSEPDDFHFFAPKIDQIIFGGESGPNARPAHPDWARGTQRQCAAAGTAFYMKQWGEWAPGEIAGEYLDPEKAAKGMSFFNGNWHECWSEVDGHNDDEPDVYRVGKKRAGRLLDGVEYSEMPV